jgi:prepilin-type N-terminal cleavage/methylation domain-containing protein
MIKKKFINYKNKRERTQEIKNSKGFTLIELLITCVVLAVLAGIAIPAFSLWMPNYKLKKAAMDIFSNLQSAKIQAIRANTRYGIFFNTGGGGSYRIVDCGPDGTCGTGDDLAPERTVNFFEYDENGDIRYGHGNSTAPIGASFDDNITFTSPNNWATFDSRGFSTNGFVYIQNDQNTTYAIGTNTVGVIMLRKWSGASWE